VETNQSFPFHYQLISSPLFILIIIHRLEIDVMIGMNTRLPSPSLRRSRTIANCHHSHQSFNHQHLLFAFQQHQQLSRGDLLFEFDSLLHVARKAIDE
jgi:hypothetical protein